MMNVAMGLARSSQHIASDFRCFRLVCIGVGFLDGATEIAIARHVVEPSGLYYGGE